MSYAAAVITPFDSSALGAQIPDPYGFPTSTTHFRSTTSINSDGLGSFDFILQPNLIFTSYTNNSGSMIGGQYSYAQASLLDAVVGRSGTQTGFPDCNGVISTNDLTLLADQYRIVGMGARLNSELIPTEATGYLTMCSLPVNDEIPPKAWINNAGNGNPSLGRGAIVEYMNFPLVDSDGYFSTLMQSYPTGAKLNAYEFNTNGLEWDAKIVSPNAYEWRDGSNSIDNKATTGIQFVSDVTTINAAATLTTSSANEAQFLQNAGWSNWVVRGTGFPASTLIGNLDIVIHVEYITSNLANQQNAKFSPIQADVLKVTQTSALKLPFYHAVNHENDGRIYARALNRLGV